jgi:hypothetical protein
MQEQKQPVGIEELPQAIISAIAQYSGLFSEQDVAEGISQGCNKIAEEYPSGCRFEVSKAQPTLLGEAFFSLTAIAPDGTGTQYDPLLVSVSGKDAFGVSPSVQMQITKTEGILCPAV